MVALMLLLLPCIVALPSVVTLPLPNPVIGAQKNSTVAFAPTGNYVALPGKWVGDNTGDSEGSQPSTAGLRWLCLNTDRSTQGWIADGIMLQICDGRSDCDAVLMHPEPSSRDSGIQFFKRDSDKTAYIHFTRCSDGGTGVNVTAPLSGGAYIKCGGTGNSITAISSFNLPPFLCEQSCDNDPTCAMFTVDKAGANCWLSKFVESGPETLYVKIPNDVHLN